MAVTSSHWPSLLGMDCELLRPVQNLPLPPVLVGKWIFTQVSSVYSVCALDLDKDRCASMLIAGILGQPSPGPGGSPCVQKMQAKSSQVLYPSLVASLWETLSSSIPVGPTGSVYRQPVSELAQFVSASVDRL